MKGIKSFVISIAVVGLLAPVFFISAAPVELSSTMVKLAIPYISEVPDGQWVGSWKNACEEASIAMVDRYYAGQKTATKTWAKAYMNGLFVMERKLWKSDANTDTAMTVKLINENSSFGAKVIDDPSIADIKSELDAGRPVIVPINGFALANKNIPFLRTGSGYHMFVIIGHDDATGEFIVHDNGDMKAGVGIRYSYQRVMDSLHDYIFATHKTDGPARAIFTFPKLVKTTSSHRVYYLSGNIKQYVTHPLVFSQKGWSWSWVNVVASSWLASFVDGASIGPK